MSFKDSVFSEYEVNQIGVKIGSSATKLFECIGSVEEEMEVKTVVKNCRGVPKKTRTRGTGSGSLTISAHIPWGLYIAMYKMDVDGLKDGVAAYGTDSLHPEMILTMRVEDEDGNRMYKAFPRATLSSGPNPSTTNGAETVAEVEFTVAVSPDENGFGLYQAVESDITQEIATAWMSNFTTELVTASA